MIDFIKVQEYKGQSVKWIQPKLDGYLIMLTPDGRVLTKNKKDWTEKCTYLKLPKHNAYIIGELHTPDGFATDVPNFVKEQKPLTFTPFAIPWYNLVPSIQQYPLDTINLLLAKLGFTPPETLLVQKSGGSVPIDDIPYLLEQARKHKFEGWVLKNAHYAEWYKLKLARTADLRVVGITTSTSATHYGNMKALIVATSEGRVVASVGSGYDESFRQKPGRVLGRIAEIEYDLLGADGRLRFPRFLRFRDDKNIVDAFSTL